MKHLYLRENPAHEACHANDNFGKASHDAVAGVSSYMLPPRFEIRVSFWNGYRLPWIGGLLAPNQGLLPRYTAGLYTGKRTKMVVSRGLGNSVFPLRIFNRPEIVLVVI